MKFHIFYLSALTLLTLSSCTFNKKKNSKSDEIAQGENRKNISDSKAEVHLEQLKLPPNFHIKIWAADVPQARSLAKSEEGIVFVGNRSKGKVYALIDADADGKADFRYTLAENLSEPNGVAYRDGSLFVAERNRILRFSDIKDNLAHPTFNIVYEKFPDSKQHGHKFIKFGPDGLLYIPVGAPCNICLPDDPMFASLARIDVDSKDIKPEIVAYGIRNTVGFDWDPHDKNLWFTDNNRDMLGDDIPSGELNKLTHNGEHFGFPYLHAQNIEDPEFFKQKPDTLKITKPQVKLGAHVAPLGMRFYMGIQFPDSYKNGIFIAEHGSWNRTKKAGYSVVFVPPNHEKALPSKFIEGWLNHKTQEIWGRPVDVLEMNDGSLLISDDFADCIYRVTYD